jgi:hypothetical protein
LGSGFLKIVHRTHLSNNSRDRALRSRVLCGVGSFSLRKRSTTILSMDASDSLKGINPSVIIRWNYPPRSRPDYFCRTAIRTGVPGVTRPGVGWTTTNSPGAVNIPACPANPYSSIFELRPDQVIAAKFVAANTICLSSIVFGARLRYVSV